MAKTSDKLSHLSKAARGSRDVASQKTEADLRREKSIQEAQRAVRAKHAVESGIDPQVVAEVDPGSVPFEEPDTLAKQMNDTTQDMNMSANAKMRKAELRSLYISSTLAPVDFWRKHLREGESFNVWSQIARNEKWDDQRVSYYEDRIDSVVEHFKQDMEDQLEEHNQMHLTISKQIGLKIMQVLPGIHKPVEIQACAVALKNIQSVSRLALGASTDNTALKGVDDFEEFLKGVSKKKAEDKADEPNV